jgi:hypothetical protein
MAATETRESCKALLDQLSTISRPKDGGPLMLLLFARMATVACEWLDGDLRIDLTSQGDVTICNVLTELGQGAGERVFPPLFMNLPLEEFEGAITRVPQMIWPLSLAKRPGLIRLSASTTVRSSTAPPSIDVDTQALYIPKAPSVPRMIAAKKVRDNKGGGHGGKTT